MFIIRRDRPQSTKSDLSHSSWMNTWCAIRFSAFSPIAISKKEDLLLPIHEPRNAESTLEDRRRVMARGHLRK
jgi:hypothetical protein